jgi:hypothetical protein
VSGEWKARPTGKDKARWDTQKTPSKVTIQAGYDYAFDGARDVTDEQVAALAALKGLPLQRLTLGSDKLTDAGVAHLAGMKELRSLYLSACPQVTDKGMAHLKKLADLEELWVTANPQVTDEGMKSLAELGKLKWLSLYGCKRITDDGARQLRGLKNLKFAYFGGTAVTDAGVADLQKALPDCEVKR